MIKSGKRWVALALFSALACVGCDTDDDSSETDATTSTDTTSSDTRTVSGDPIRFAIEVSNDVPESLYAQLNEEDGQPTWITVKDASGERIWLEARCETPDCDGGGGVCGAALPLVRDFTAGTFTGEISYTWNGVMSTFDDANAGCEERAVAPDGDYTATFCWGFQAELNDPDADATAENGAPGRVVDPVCVDVPFSIPDDDGDVVYGIFGG